MFPFPFIPALSIPLLVCDAVDFDGTSDYATRGAGLTGVSDSKLFTFSVWLNAASFAGSYVLSNTNGRFTISTAGPDKYYIEGNNSAGTAILNIVTTSDVPSGWVHLMGSVDLSNTSKRHLYVNDVSDLTVVTYTNDTIDLTAANWTIGGTSAGASLYDGDIAELIFWPGVYADLSVESYRRLFISSSGKPVDLTSAISTLGAPAIYMHIDDGETANNFVANDDGGATGGTFSMTGGSLTTAASSPSD